MRLSTLLKLSGLAIYGMASAQAAIISYNFTGVLDDAIVNPSTSDVVYPAGTLFTGTVGYDTTKVTQDSNNGTIGIYSGTSASGASIFQFSIGSDGPISTQSPTILVGNDTANSIGWGEDDPFLLNLNGVPLRTTEVDMTFVDFTGTLLGNSDLPTTTFPGSAFDGGFFYIDITNQAGNLGPIRSEGHLLTINGANVPEPGTWAVLAGLLAIGLAWMRRRK